jgi:hypothetical protein
MNYSKQTDRLDIYMDDALKTITIRQRWEYRWKSVGGASPWTEGEKRMFQQQANMLITSVWEGAHKVNVEGSSSFARKNVNRDFQFRFDIQQSPTSPLLGNPHWVVTITKYPHNNFVLSRVRWESREVFLDHNDVSPERKVLESPKTYQFPVAHEFGHMIGNVRHIFPGSHDDEYSLNSVKQLLLSKRRQSDFHQDIESIMNFGSSLRERHFDYLLRELNTIIPNTRFYFRSVLLWR